MAKIYNFDPSFGPKISPDHLSCDAKIFIGPSGFLSYMSDSPTNFREHCSLPYTLCDCHVCTLQVGRLTIPYCNSDSDMKVGGRQVGSVQKLHDRHITNLQVGGRQVSSSVQRICVPPTCLSYTQYLSTADLPTIYLPSYCLVSAYLSTAGLSTYLLIMQYLSTVYLSSFPFVSAN